MDKYIICFNRKKIFKNEPSSETAFVLDDKGNIKKYTSRKRAEAAAKVIFKKYKNLFNYTVVPYSQEDD